MLLELALCALAGFCAKLVDERVDSRLPLPLIGAIIGAILYGAAIGGLTTSTALSSLFLALAVAAILAGKFNHPLHILGLLAFTLVLVVRPMVSFDPWLFSLFLVLGLLDELELKLLRPLAFLNEQRLWTPIGALALAIWDGFGPAMAAAWKTLDGGITALLMQNGSLFLLAIVAFDLAYRFADYAGPLLFTSRPSKVIAKARRKTRR
jgi:hypothetical protein